MEQLLIAERQRIENQRQEVLRLQDEYEKSREVAAKNIDESKQERCEDDVFTDESELFDLYPIYFRSILSTIFIIYNV